LEDREVAVERIREVAAIWNLRSLLGLRLRLKRARAKAIHLHASPPGPGRTLLTLADAAGPTPIVLSLHGAETPGGSAAAPLRRAAAALDLRGAARARQMPRRPARRARDPLGPRPRVLLRAGRRRSAARRPRSPHARARPRIAGPFPRRSPRVAGAARGRRRG